MKKWVSGHAVSVLLLIYLALTPMFSSAFGIELMGKFVVFIIFAIALDLVWGYAGLLSLGHAVFFGLGGYVLALSYSIQDGVPGFMSRFDIQEIPGFLKPLQSIPAALGIGVLLPAAVAGIVGYFIFKSRVSGVYFSLITLALAKLMEMIAINNQKYTGGFNGLMGLPRFPINGKPMDLVPYFYLVLFVTVLVYLFSYWLTRSHFGKIVKSIRENEGRISFFSYNVANYKIFIYIVSGFLSGLAGMLYVPMVGFFSPQDVGLSMSTMIIVWLAIGGRGTIVGAAIGTLLINVLSNKLSEQYPDQWQLFLGIVIILVVLFFPNGIYGTLKDAAGRWFKPKEEVVPDTKVPAIPNQIRE
ncbi:urea ABC transporter permease subunit UrtC [Paenibacillus timonensis]|uniref:Urea ABC transporter permease subunit UrtC n=1 Tax=Paenibacillus timonensis TaxID=225915 RepID=A0ABW3S7R6_9BACL|nr:urea ABC transporter permease subunit UrtC [Paenibacillus timonensis]MBW4838232.1 urea ABC transporter permease subunit UrtC [Paenibacillaceae bacterium]MCH1639003.1 urea ABC transporter permease subunit UrtC [Paenibacillus timonensis]